MATQPEYSYLADLVQDGVYGLLFKVGDAADLRSKILSMIREPGLIDRLRQGIPEVKAIEEDAGFIEKLYLKFVKGENTVGEKHGLHNHR